VNDPADPVGPRAGISVDPVVRALGAEAAAVLPAALTEAWGRPVAVGGVHRLSGGASRQTFRVDLTLGDANGDLTGDHGRGQTGDPVGRSAAPGAPPGSVIVQRERPGSVGANLPMPAQVALLRAAATSGVPVPAVLAEGGGRGSAFVVLEELAGESVARRILRDDAFAAARGGLARQAGRILAAVHRIPLDTTSLPGGDPLQQMTALLDLLGEPHPAFELGLRWLAANRPPARDEVVVHGDFRMGNLLVAPDGVTAVLDWELAHRGAAAEDLGWFCGRAWRFGSPHRAGGVGTLDALLAGYGEAGGEVPSPHEVTWWEAYGTLRWGLICVLQASVHLRGDHRSVELAAIGRRASECEEDLLELVAGPSDYEPLPAAEADPPAGPHDRPTAVELLDAVGEHLELLRGTLEGAAAFHLRVTGNVVAMVAREVALGPAQAAAHAERLARLDVADEGALARAVRAGELDADLDAVTALVREDVRDKLAVAHPGYWRGDG